MPPNVGRTTGCSAGAMGAGAAELADALVDDEDGCAESRAKSSGQLCCAACSSSSVARLIAAMAASRLHDILARSELELENMSCLRGNVQRGGMRCFCNYC